MFLVLADQQASAKVLSAKMISLYVQFIGQPNNDVMHRKMVMIVYTTSKLHSFALLLSLLLKRRRTLYETITAHQNTKIAMYATENALSMNISPVNI